MRRGAGVRAEAAEFHAVVTQTLELVQDDVEVVGRLFLVEQVRPGADRDASFGHDRVLCGWRMSARCGGCAGYCTGGRISDGFRPRQSAACPLSFPFHARRDRSTRGRVMRRPPFPGYVLTTSPVCFRKLGSSPDFPNW